MLKVYLNKNEEIRILEGHPWIFSNEVNHFEGNIVSGDVAEVYTYDNRFVCLGFFNANSKIMIRVLTLKQEEKRFILRLSSSHFRCKFIDYI